MAGLNKFDTKLIPFKKLVFGVVVLDILTIVLVLVLLDKIPPVVPLFYGLPLSEDQLVKAPFLILPGGVALLIVFLNSLLTFFIKDDFLKKVLVIASLGTSFFAVITTLKIIFLVGNF
jgi:hypothetical protein